MICVFTVFSLSSLQESWLITKVDYKTQKSPNFHKCIKQGLITVMYTNCLETTSLTSNCL